MNNKNTHAHRRTYVSAHQQRTFNIVIIIVQIRLIRVWKGIGTRSRWLSYRLLSILVGEKHDLYRIYFIVWVCLGDIRNFVRDKNILYYIIPTYYYNVYTCGTGVVLLRIKTGGRRRTRSQNQCYNNNDSITFIVERIQKFGLLLYIIHVQLIDVQCRIIPTKYKNAHTLTHLNANSKKTQNTKNIYLFLYILYIIIYYQIL